MELIKDTPILLFTSQKNWRDWLEDNHDQSQGVWIMHAKKSSSKDSMSYQEALGVALCYGWIDSQKHAYDSDYYLQKFTPRGVRSIWSKTNVAKAESRIKTGSMQPSGLAAIMRAKQDGRWDAAYDSPGTSKVPEDFQTALDKNPKAKHFFETLNKANTYAFCWRLQTAKLPETRRARIEKFIAMLNKGEKFH